MEQRRQTRQAVTGAYGTKRKKREEKAASCVCLGRVQRPRDARRSPFFRDLKEGTKKEAPTFVSLLPPSFSPLFVHNRPAWEKTGCAEPALCRPFFP